MAARHGPVSICAALALTAACDKEEQLAAPPPPAKTAAPAPPSASAPPVAPKGSAACDARVDRSAEPGQAFASWLEWWRELPARDGSEDEPPPTTEWEARTMLCGNGCKKPGAYALCSGCTGDKGTVIDAPLATGKNVCAYYLVLQDPQNHLLVFEREGPCASTAACAKRLSLTVRSGERVQLTARLGADGDTCTEPPARFDWFFGPSKKSRVLAIEQSPKAGQAVADVALTERGVVLSGPSCKTVVPFEQVDL